MESQALLTKMQGNFKCVHSTRIVQYLLHRNRAIKSYSNDTCISNSWQPTQFEAARSLQHNYIACSAATTEADASVHFQSNRTSHGSGGPPTPSQSTAQKPPHRTRAAWQSYLGRNDHLDMPTGADGVGEGVTTAPTEIARSCPCSIVIRASMSWMTGCDAVYTWGAADARSRRSCLSRVISVAIPPVELSSTGAVLLIGALTDKEAISLINPSAPLPASEWESLVVACSGG